MGVGVLDRLGNTTLTQVGISVGTERAGAAVAAVLANSAPFFVAVIARFALAEPITRLRAAGLVIGFGGVLLVVFSDPGKIAHGSQLAIGFGLALLGALGWAAGGLGMRVLTQREPDLDIPGITAAQFLAGGIPLIPLVLLAGGSTDWSRPSLDGQLAYLIIGGQVLVYLGFNAALSRWPSTRVYAWTFLVPAVAVLIEAVRGTLPGVGATIGVALVIIGVAIVDLRAPSGHGRWQERRPPRESTYPTRTLRGTDLTAESGSFPRLWDAAVEPRRTTAHRFDGGEHKAAHASTALTSPTLDGPTWRVADADGARPSGPLGVARFPCASSQVQPNCISTACYHDQRGRCRRGYRSLRTSDWLSSTLQPRRNATTSSTAAVERVLCCRVRSRRSSLRDEREPRRPAVPAVPRRCWRISIAAPSLPERLTITS